MNGIQVLVQNEIQRILSSDPAQAIMIAARAIEQANNQIAELKPKAIMYEAVMASEDLHEMSAVAKILNFRDMGRNNLFAYLQDKKILRFNNEPYQPFVTAGYFEVKEESYDRGYGMKIYRKTMATQKGLEYIRKILLEDGYAINER